MSCRISTAQVRGEGVVWRGAQGAYAGGTLKAGVDRPRADRAAGYPTCSGWFVRPSRSGGLSRHSGELRPVRSASSPNMTPSNERISKGFKKQPAGKIEVNLSTCRPLPASSSIAGRVIVEIGSRRAVTPCDSVEKGF